MIAWHGIFQMLDRVSFGSRRKLFTNKTRRSDKARRVSFVNNGRREQKETLSSIWKIPCQAIMFGVSKKRPSSN
ncbi:hypothetical protein T03_14402 [Trichinella britovi]|uniref:Uncharacterized protein n=1 Tax=Trichinella britovi TaxID=45882 RepID=A0A0V1C595_TRIBR|nr:hypothetical protein T03_14402 [Trichinella britovi]